jgi:divalent metal cation (Fe/Co/Zn/Cd) transporter
MGFHEPESLSRADPGIDAEPPARDWTRVALWLVALTMAYNLVEAGVALGSGIVARSVALVGFGLDSVIECAAAGVLLWRLRLEWSGVQRETLEAAEHRVHRFVGATFLALAAYVGGQAFWTLTAGAAPAESVLGIVLAVASLIVMPLVAWGKLRAAARIASPALRAEAKETLACSVLSFTLLLGLGANAVWGCWWADPLAALAMLPWLIREGREGLRGEACGDGCGAA